MLTLATDLTDLLNSEIKGEWIAVLAIGGGLTIALVSTLVGTLRSIVVARAREQSRREIAAYVAEGSMSPDDAARLLEAGRPAADRHAHAHRPRGGCCGGRAEQA